ncbi:hypothetical protein BDQ17DRAFT_1527931 [Cyathus striatus]|nr:hypothetical protein BDQ17DRAFT_1527931 [Cyathus striatus]
MHNHQKPLLPSYSSPLAAKSAKAPRMPNMPVTLHVRIAIISDLRETVLHSIRVPFVSRSEMSKVNGEEGKDIRRYTQSDPLPRDKCQQNPLQYGLQYGDGNLHLEEGGEKRGKNEVRRTACARLKERVYALVIPGREGNTQMFIFIVYRIEVLKYKLLAPICYTNGSFGD